jgi:hypothetical protein
MARMVQKWRKPTNPVGQGRLTTYAEARDSVDMNEENFLVDSSSSSSELRSFSIGAPHAGIGVREIQDLIRKKTHICSARASFFNPADIQGNC